MKKTIQLSLLASSLVSSLFAQNPYTLGTIEVEAAQGVTLNKKDVTDNVTIITKEAIKESRVTNLEQALNRLGGISTTNNGGLGQPSSLFIRGMASQRVLILIDGLRYNDPSTPGAIADISQVMLNNIERIEIIKGAQSGIWGADASGGVINIITSGAAQGVHAKLDLEYGSFNSSKTALSASYGDKDFEILLGASFLNTDGFSAVEPKKAEENYGKRYDDLDLEEDAYKNTSLNLALALNLSKEDRLELAYKSINAQADFDSFAGIYGDSSLPNSDFKSKFFNINFKHSDAINDIKVSYNYSNFDRVLELASWSG